MSDPRRLLAGGEKDLGATLLRAALTDTPLESSRERTAAALGLTGAATAGFGAAGGGAATAAKVAGAGVAIKWLGAVVAGVVIVGGASSYRAARSKPTTGEKAFIVPAAAPRGTGSSRVEISPPRPIALPPAPPSAMPAILPSLSVALPPSAARQPAAVASPSRPALHSIGREVAMLDDARNALAAGDASEALHRLDAYGHAFPSGALAFEANVARVEALEASGDSARASSLARGLLAKNPDAPQAAHLRSIVRELQRRTDATNP